METLNTILSWIECYKGAFTIIFSIIGGIFVYLKYGHSKGLEYTASERREWRKSLRRSLKILILAHNDNKKISQNKIEFARANVLSNLNPISTNGSLDSKVFDIFKKEFKKDSLEIEITALQLLLKFDWDRAKKENKLFPPKIEEVNYIKKLNEKTKKKTKD